MPAEKIATTFVSNGASNTHTNTLRIQWGAKGDAPDAPNGWVNAGYAQIGITAETDVTGETRYVTLDAEEITHLIRVLKRVKRKAY